MVDAKQLTGFEPPAAMTSTSRLSIQQIARFISDLQQAERPVILVGGGVPGRCWDDVRAAGRRLNVPCFPTWNALDVISSDYENYGDGRGPMAAPAATSAFRIVTCSCPSAVAFRDASPAATFRVCSTGQSIWSKSGQPWSTEISTGAVRCQHPVRRQGVYTACLDRARSTQQTLAGFLSLDGPRHGMEAAVRIRFVRSSSPNVSACLIRSCAVSEKMGATDVLVGRLHGGNIVVSNHAF